MAESSIKTLEGIAREYDRRLGPALFSPWISHTLDAAHVKPGDKVLDVACGTGELAVDAAFRVTPDGEVTGVDLNPGMLAVARTKSDRITWLEGNAEDLPFEDHQFNVVTCQFGLMLFAHPARALSEMYRVLAPGGHMTVTVFGELTEQPVYRALADIYGELVDEAIANLLRMPFALGNPSLLDSLFTEAGIHDSEQVRLEEMALFPSLRDLVLADVEGWFPFAGISLSDAQIERVIEEAEEDLAGYRRADGQVRFPVPVYLVTGTRLARTETGGPVVI